MKNNEFVLDIKNNINALVEKYPEFEKDINYSSDKKCGKIAILTIHNTNNPRFPLIITMYEKEGIYLDMRYRNSIIEFESGIDEHVLDMIELIFQDRVYITLAYKNKENYEKLIPSVLCFYYDTEKTEHEWLDNLSEYKSLIQKLEKPIPWYCRKFALYKGIIETSNWSGTTYRIFNR